MAIQDSSYSTLEKIRTKVRRLTRSPSISQLPDADIDTYVNSFLLYDLPSHITLSSLASTFTFYSKPNISVYATTTTDTTDSLYNFDNLYTCIHSTAYIAGFGARFYQSREEFYNDHSYTSTIRSIGTGNGVTTSYSGTISDAPLTQNHILFSSHSSTYESLSIVDLPTSTVSGNLVAQNTTTSLGTINYITGIYSFDYGTAPANEATVSAHFIPYIAGQPHSILYYDNEFTLYPTPDQAYKITIDVQKRPSALLQSSSMPELSRWWEFISYGCAKKIFEDRMDIESIAKITPEFRKQELLVLRPSILQQTGNRVSTIYTDSNGRGNNGI